MKSPKIIIERESYIKRIVPFMRKSVVKVLIGHRRVGKSYILFQLIEFIKREEPHANVIYINKEDIQYSEIKDFRDLNQYIISKSCKEKMNYIFIDEIQEIADFRIAIRSLALDENNDIYITGSNSNLFSSDLANEFGGRYVEFVIYSLSYLEFINFHKLQNDDSSLELYTHYGGLPYLMHLPLKEDVVMEYINGIYSTIVLRDVVQRKGIRNTIFLEQLIRFLAGNVGNLFSSKKISDFLKNQKIEISPNQVSEYANSLSEAFVVHRLGRYDIIGKRHFERGEKYYFENLGIKNAVAGYKRQDRAGRLENLVCNHLLYCGYDVKVGSFDYEEIDFVCTKSGETIYVQVAIELTREDTISREFGNLLKIKDNYPKIVVSGEKSFENSYEGIEHIYIRDFLSSTLTHSVLK